jgi:hypothetical protein
MLKLVEMINEQRQETALPQVILQKSFERCWSEFETKLKLILESRSPAETPPTRPVEDMIRELLEITRSLQRAEQDRTDEALRSKLPNLRTIAAATAPGVSSATGRSRESMLLNLHTLAEALDKRPSIDESLARALEAILGHSPQKDVGPTEEQSASE